MSDLWKYIVLSDGTGEYPVIFHRSLSHKDMATGGLAAGLSGWSKVTGRCLPISAGFIAMPDLRVDEASRSESLGVGARKGLDQALFTQETPMGDVKKETVRITDERLADLAQGYETWGKTNSSKPQIDIDTAAALRELIALRQPGTRMEGGGDVQERCFICSEPFKAGELVLSDVTEGLGHRACFGEDREGYVNLETGEPIGDDEPIPSGWPYEVDPAPSSPTVGELEAKLSQTRGAAVNELAVEIDANRTLRAQLAEARKVLESAVDFVTESFDQPSDELHALLMQIGEFLASLGENQDAE